MQALASALELTPAEAAYALAAVFLAGIVRGFSGFALSALCMASLVFVMPPVEILAICVVLEGVATLLMTRRGFAEADKPMVWGLIAGVLVGAPLGLALTVTIDVGLSRMLALGVILALASAQLIGARPMFLASRAGLLGSGVAAGVVQGVAASGGMVVALYALARDLPAAAMRASLVMYLSVTIVVHALYFTAFGLFTETALLRGGALAAPVAAGVLIGARLFSPRLQLYYRPACLGLLVALAIFGLARAAI